MTEAVKHTPGTWEACERGDYSDDGIVILGNDMRVAVVNREKDAALIAAAPDLYEALSALQLQALQSSVNHAGNEWGLEALAMTKAALAKAEGRL